MESSASSRARRPRRILQHARVDCQTRSLAFEAWAISSSFKARPTAPRHAQGAPARPRGTSAAAPLEEAGDPAAASTPTSAPSRAGLTWPTRRTTSAASATTTAASLAAAEAHYRLALCADRNVGAVLVQPRRRPRGPGPLGRSDRGVRACARARCPSRGCALQPRATDRARGVARQ